MRESCLRSGDASTGLLLSEPIAAGSSAGPFAAYFPSAANRPRPADVVVTVNVGTLINEHHDDR